MSIYNKFLVIRANEIGLVTNEAFLDACQELIDAKTSVDVGSIYTHHLGNVLPLGDGAIALFKNIHNWRKGESNHES